MPAFAAWRMPPVANRADKARLIRQDRVLALVALPREDHRLRLGHEARRRLHRRDHRGAVRLVVARLVSQRQVAVDVVLDAAGVALLLDLVEVVADAAVEIPRIDRLRRNDRRRRQLGLGPCRAGNSVVRHVVLARNLRGGRHARRRVQAQRNRRRNRLVLSRRRSSRPGHAAVLPERIEANRAAAEPALLRTERKLLIQVDRRAVQIAAAVAVASRRRRMPACGVLVCMLT